MATIKRFEAEDIGGNLLPILTEGLYSDPLDALREYIQNSIDAKCENITLDITSHTVTITDDGRGMTRATAEMAIKLGVSTKNPKKDVGFRGIGIYSGFNIAKRLEVYTKTSQEATGSKIIFDFHGMREKLQEEDRLREEGADPALFLEPLLSETVSVVEDNDNVIKEHGTKLILVSINDNVYKRISNPSKVKKYLRSTVPLPFHPEFRYSDMIAAEFVDYATVTLFLSFNDKKAQLYRPYFNDLFERGGRIAPEFFPIENTKTGVVYGKAWACHNDIKSVLRATDLRGLQITKKGFAIGNRAYLEQFFTQVSFYRRITGEIIIENEDLKPNAARSDFEGNNARDEFLLAFNKVTKDISRWGNEIQSKLKAEEVLISVSEKSFKINEDLPSNARSIDGLLAYAIQLDSLFNMLNLHKRWAKIINENLYDRTMEVIKFAKKFIRDSIEENKRSEEKTQSRKTKSKEHRTSAPTQAETQDAPRGPGSFYDLLESLDLLQTEDIRRVMKYLDDSIIRPHMDDIEYFEELESLRDHLEGDEGSF